mgnify:CR=1 FL=1
MTTRPSTTDPDHRAAEYRAALDGPPRPDHVAELTRRGIPIPASQAVASALLTDAIRREAVQR